MLPTINNTIPSEQQALLMPGEAVYHFAWIDSRAAVALHKQPDSGS